MADTDNIDLNEDFDTFDSGKGSSFSDFLHNVISPSPRPAQPESKKETEHILSTQPDSATVPPVEKAQEVAVPASTPVVVPSTIANETPAAVTRPSEPVERVYLLRTDQIHPNPHQPRKQFDSQALQELAASIARHGIIQPIVVTQTEKGDYELIAGERRLRASELIGLSVVPAIIRESSERQKLELAVIENVQRANLNPIEEAKAYQRLIDDFKLSQESVAARIGKSRAAVANTLRLLQLPLEIQRGLSEGKITMSHARALLGLPGLEQRLHAYHEIIKNQMTVHELEAQVRSAKGPRAVQRKLDDPQIFSWQEKAQAALGTKVKIEKHGKTGKMIIEFYSEQELRSILDKIEHKEE